VGKGVGGGGDTKGSLLNLGSRLQLLHLDQKQTNLLSKSWALFNQSFHPNQGTCDNDCFELGYRVSGSSYLARHKAVREYSSPTWHLYTYLTLTLSLCQQVGGCKWDHQVHANMECSSSKYNRSLHG
jgi:hypothetical protein